jgi:ubiquinone/menaquinone biosynthesis C-methylase UbiE
LAKVAGGIAASAEEIPLPDDSFDAVYCFDVLEHCEHPDRALREMLRVSKDRVIVYVTSMASEENLLKDPTHIVFLPFSEWLRLFNSVAEIVAVDYAGTGALLRHRVGGG